MFPSTISALVNWLPPSSQSFLHKNFLRVKYVRTYILCTLHARARELMCFSKEQKKFLGTEWHPCWLSWLDEMLPGSKGAFWVQRSFLQLRCLECSPMHVLLYVRNDVPSYRVWDIRLFKNQIIHIFGYVVNKILWHCFQRRLKNPFSITRSVTIPNKCVIFLNSFL